MLGTIYNNTLFCLLFFAVTSSHSHANKAPDFSIRGVSKIVRLAEYQGHVVYLDFWASWCKPCRKSFPFMNDMHDKYYQKGLRIIAINLDAEPRDAQKFLQQNPARFILAYDPRGNILDKYPVTVMPTSYLINRQGQIIFTHTGFTESGKQKIEDKISNALSKK